MDEQAHRSDFLLFNIVTAIVVIVLVLLQADLNLSSFVNLLKLFLF